MKKHRKKELQNITANNVFGKKVKFSNIKTNKRAQRTLGRSPDEKVKGHSGTIYIGPLMLCKYQGSSKFLQEDFQDFPILHDINQICPPRQGLILY